MIPAVLNVAAIASASITWAALEIAGEFAGRHRATRPDHGARAAAWIARAVALAFALLALTCARAALT